MARTLNVTIKGRIPRSTRIRIVVGRVTHRLGLVGVTERIIGRLPVDIKVGTGRWQRRWMTASIRREETS